MKLLNTLLAVTANTMTVGMLLAILYVILGGLWAHTTDPAVEAWTGAAAPAAIENVYHA